MPPQMPRRASPKSLPTTRVSTSTSGSAGIRVSRPRPGISTIIRGPAGNIDLCGSSKKPHVVHLDDVRETDVHCLNCLQNVTECAAMIAFGETVVVSHDGQASVIHDADGRQHMGTYYNHGPGPGGGA